MERESERESERPDWPWCHFIDFFFSLMCFLLLPPSPHLQGCGGEVSAGEVPLGLQREK